MRLAKARFQDYGLLAGFVAIAYWPLSTLHHMTLWDSIEGWFPLRYFLSDCIRNGVTPLWNPYLMGGYPFYGDPQSGLWYPMPWLLGGLAPYNFTLFRIEYLLTFLIAATGMYELARSFRLMRLAALVTAVSYCSCGFFVSNAEHLAWVISAAWLPWVFWSYHRMHQTGSIGYGLLAALFLFLLLSGGYPAFFIVTSYLLLLFFLFSILSRRSAAWVWKSLSIHLILGFTFLMLSAGALLSWYQAMPLTTRGSGVNLQQANICPFSPRCLISFLLPFSTLKDEGGFDTDIAMRNAYIGLCCLLALPFAFRSILRNRLLMIIGALTVICMLASFGAYTPLRKWLYRFVPLMDIFRFPSMFRIFAILGAVLAAGHGLDLLCTKPETYRRPFTRLLILVIAVLGFILAVSIAVHGRNWGWGILCSNFEAYQALSSYAENLQLQAIVQIILLGLLLMAISVKQGRYFRGSLLLAFCAVDMIAATSMNAFSTIVSPERAPNIERPLAAAPHDFPVPDNNQPLSAWRDEALNLPGLRTNTGIYFKKPVAGGYNSFVMKGHDRTQRSPIHDSLEANSYLYFAESMSVDSDQVQLRNRAEVRVDLAVYLRYSNIAAPRRSMISVRSFSPNEISAVVFVSDTACINLQQNRAPGWRLFMDGKEAPIITSNYTQMAAIVPPGRHSLRWTFNLALIRFMLIATGVVFLLLILGLTLFRRRLFPQIIGG